MICIYTSCTPEPWTAMAVLSVGMSGGGDQHRSVSGKPLICQSNDAALVHCSSEILYLSVLYICHMAVV